MIYLLPKGFKFDGKFISELQEEFSKAKKVNIICHEHEKDESNMRLEVNNLNNPLVLVYYHDLDIEYKKIMNEIPTKVEEILKNIVGFNYPQYLASTLAAENNLLINAGAGTGKTTTIIETVLNLLLDEKAELEDILLTTFTNNTTNDMYKKIYFQLNERWRLTGNKRCLQLLENINNLKICTIHKYFKSLLGELGAWYGYSNNVSMSVPKDKLKQFVGDIIKNQFEIIQFKGEDYGFYDITLRKLLLEIINNEKIDVTKIEAYRFADKNDCEQIRKIEEFIRLTCNKVTEEFMARLIEEDKVLTKDLSCKLNDMLIYEHDFSKKIRKYKYIFVDECQDTSNKQFEIIQRVLEITGAKLFAVGDSRQAIYRFRNADPNSMNNFNGVKDITIDLIDNYRTTENILDEINTIFEFLDKTYTRLKPIRKGGNCIKVKRFGWGKEVSCIKEIIKIEIEHIRKKRSDNKGMKNKEDRIAILVRNNYEAKSIGEELQHAGINCTVDKGGSLFQSKAARELLALIRVILYPVELIYKVQLLDTGYCNFNLGMNSKELLEDYEFSIIDRALNDILSYINNNNNNKTSFSLLTDIIYKFDPSKDDSLYRENLMLILEELINTGTTSNFTDMEQFLMMQLTANNEVKSSEERDGQDEINILTFHSTKGLEFDTVIILTNNNYHKNLERSKAKFEIAIIGDDVGLCFKKEVNVKKEDIELLENNTYKKIKKLQEEEVELDEKNLLYVALTRATDKLYVLAPKEIKNNTHAKILEKSGFYKRMG